MDASQTGDAVISYDAHVNSKRSSELQTNLDKELEKLPG